MNLRKLVMVIVSLALFLTACGPEGTTPVASQEAKPQALPVPAPTFESATMYLADGQAFPLDPVTLDVTAIPVPEPPDAPMEILELPAEGLAPLIADLRAISAEQGNAPHMALVMPPAAGGCDVIAATIIGHIVSVLRIPIPDEKWAGPVFPTLERLFTAMEGGVVILRGYAIAADGNSVAVWFSFLDTVKKSSREIMFILSESAGPAGYEGTLYPMGEPIVIKYFGPLSEVVVQKFGEIIGVSGGKALVGAEVFFTTEGLALVGGLAAIGYGINGVIDAASKAFKKADTFTKYWGGCLNRALQGNPKYKKWKEQQKNQITSYALAMSPSGQTYYASEADAKAAAGALVGVAVVVIIVKVLIAAGSGQVWVVLVPVP